MSLAKTPAHFAQRAQESHFLAFSAIFARDWFGNRYHRADERTTLVDRELSYRLRR